MKEKRLSDYTDLYQLASRQIVLLDGLNFRKFRNAIGILYEYLTRKTVLKYRPVVVRMEPTSHCNLRCPTCHPFGNTFGGPMKQDVFDRLLDRIPFPDLLKATLYLFGEPFFNRHLAGMIQAVGNKGVPTSTSTNFNIFSEKKANDIIDSRLSWIIICVDGADQETYEKYRVGGKLDKVLENIEILVETKKRRGTSWPAIEVQCIRFDHNKHQIDEIREVCQSLGVERFTVKRDVLSQMNIDFTTLQNERTGESSGKSHNVSGASHEKAGELPAREMKEIPHIEPKNGARCMYLYGTLHVDYDGSVLPCCVGRSVFGNLLDNTFEEIWNNEKFVAARTFFASGFKEKNLDIDIPCYTCPLFFPEDGEQADRVNRVRNQ